ncbi:uncharacterized protein LOC122044144 [Zingiber officinale]|uniref:uncharacterized protein LOC122044144 n=1 Tax=Zingiber officinale TaxID=94328 RepID=UPI001C4DA7E5|nr:uncharacterized protein LOC122044144 [Zingiber officinale]
MNKVFRLQIGRSMESNSQAKVTNRDILRGLRARLDHAGGSWVDELLSVLWAHRTTPREAIGVTPFHLVYGSEAVVSVEVGVEFDRVQLYDDENIEQRLMELNLVDEARDKAVIRLMAYRQRIKQNYNRRVILRSFQRRREISTVLQLVDSSINSKVEKVERLYEFGLLQVLRQDSSLFVFDLQVLNGSEFSGVGRIDLRLKRAGLFIEPHQLRSLIGVLAPFLLQ